MRLRNARLQVSSGVVCDEEARTKTRTECKSVREIEGRDYWVVRRLSGLNVQHGQQ